MINEYVSIDDYGEVQPAKLYKCEYCGYETDKKEEVWCWKCEKKRWFNIISERSLPLQATRKGGKWRVVHSNRLRATQLLKH